MAPIKRNEIVSSGWVKFSEDDQLESEASGGNVGQSFDVTEEVVQTTFARRGITANEFGVVEEEDFTWADFPDEGYSVIPLDAQFQSQTWWTADPQSSFALQDVPQIQSLETNIPHIISERHSPPSSFPLIGDCDKPSPPEETSESSSADLNILSPFNNNASQSLIALPHLSASNTEQFTDHQPKRTFIPSRCYAEIQ